MDNKVIFALFLIFGCMLSFSSCLNFNNCESDVFGNYMTLIVPINTSPAQDTFQVGDTLWIEANFDKYVGVEDETERIFLEDFNFFTSFLISEISDTTENFVKEIEIVEEVGQVEELTSVTTLSYPLFFEESDIHYHIKLGIVFKEIGRYYIGFSSNPLVFERYEHPAMYRCEDERRKEVDIRYDNLSTTQDAYDSIFLETGVDYLIRLMDYESYASVGTHSFIVIE